MCILTVMYVLVYMVTYALKYIMRMVRVCTHVRAGMRWVNCGKL